ncbi:MATE family efflux transporter [Paracoccaceae bacterium GXU_MW_L88]
MSQSAAITHRRVLAMAIPIMLSNATVPLLGAVDTAVIGQLGRAAPIGAVAIGGVILSTLYWIFGFLRMGVSGLAAQARGAGDTAETGALLMRGLMIGAAGGLLLILLQIPLFAVSFMLSPASPEVENLARSYMSIRIWSAPAAIMIYAIVGWLIAMERSRSVFIHQLLVNGVNVVLNVTFVLGFGWGVAGVALGTLISEIAGVIFGLWLCRDAFAGDQWRDWPRVFNRERLINMARVNTDIMIRSFLLSGGILAFLFLGAREGDVALAANQILLQFINVTAFALDGFAFAAEALVGYALGARSRGGLQRAAILTSQWGLLLCAVMSLVFLLIGGRIVEVMTTAEDVRAAAKGLLPYIILAPLIGLPGWMLDGIFIGATRTGDMRRAMIEATGAYAVALVLLPLAFGNHGLWLAFLFFYITRALTLWRRYPAIEAQASRSTPTA